MATFWLKSKPNRYTVPSSHSSLESQARSNLNLTVTDLRKALGSEAWRVRSVTTATLRLDLTGADCDLLAFDSLAASKEPIDLQHAVALYSCPLLADCPEPWILAPREQREEAYLQALQALVEDARARHETGHEIDFLRRVVAYAPHRDSAQKQLMCALVAGGDTNAALLVYQEFVRFLSRNDPHARPNREVEQFYREIRSGARCQADPPILSLPSAPPTIASSVPARITPLIGRENDRLQVVEALCRSRLVTLVGAGGIGKTSQ